MYVCTNTTPNNSKATAFILFKNKFRAYHKCLATFSVKTDMLSDCCAYLLLLLDYYCHYWILSNKVCGNKHHLQSKEPPEFHLRLKYNPLVAADCNTFSSVNMQICVYL